MDMHEKLAELLDYAQTRRGAVHVGLATAGAVVLAGNVGLGRALAQGLSDMDILQFALTLEHLEARMYRDMLAKNILTGKEQTYFRSFGDHEAAHVTALTDTISKMGGAPNAAKDSYKFPAFNNRGDILNFAKTAEDIGVGAYQGAAAAIKDKAILAAAGSILQVEARHVAIVNLLMGIDPVPMAFTQSLTVQQVLDKVNPILS